MLPYFKPSNRFRRLSALFLWIRKKASILLAFSLLIPVALLILNEVEALQDYEASFEVIAARQLESITGSLNQEIWYATANWIERASTSNSPNVFPVFVDAKVRLRNKSVAEILYQRTPNRSLPSPTSVLIRSDLSKLSIQPFLPVFVPSSEGGWLVFVRKSASDTLLFFCNPQSYVQREAESVLESLLEQNISYELVQNEVVLSKLSLKQKALVDQEVWTFPGLKMRLSSRPQESELMTSRRITRATLLVGSALLIILLVIFGLEMIVRREKQLSRLKSDFVANVSHELKTPLALIRMYGESLHLGRVKNEEQKQKYYGIIIRESERLTKLINNVLHLAKIDAEKKVYKDEPCDLNHLIRQTLETFDEAFKKEGFEIAVHLDDSIPSVRADNDAVAESLVNLIDNAMKYSGETKRIFISSTLDKGAVCIAIQDSGIGIAKAELSRIFDQFYRVESSLTPNTRGTGLGLSLVNHFMQAQGGRISVDSEPGKGTLFTLHFALDRNITKPNEL